MADSSSCDDPFERLWATQRTASIYPSAGADNLTADQRARVEELKAQRALLGDPLDRIAFDNSGGPERAKAGGR